MYLFHVLCAVLCATFVLTLATKKEKKSDSGIENGNNSSSKTVENVLKGQLQNASKISSKEKFSTEKIHILNISNLNQPTLEGGGKVELATARLPILKPDSPTISPENSSSTSNTTKEGKEAKETVREAKVSARKEVYLPKEVRYNIKPRKGVGNETSSTEADSPLEDVNLVYKLNTSLVQPHISKPINKEMSAPKPESQSNTTSKNVSSTMESLEKVSTAKVKKHKLKPTVTIGGSNVDEPIPASPTKAPPLGMPRKIDYIVPVMITIFALPLLGVATYVLYRRGRDCWDKRHYRRMDFLIDGMYNE